MTDTRTGYIYKIEVDNELLYIGSTTNLRVRKNCHKSRCCNEKDKEYNKNLYKILRENFNINRENFNNKVKFLWVCDVEFNKRCELGSVEAEYIKLYNPIGNTTKPYGKEWNQNEYNIKNKDKIKEYQKKNYNKNKDKRLKYQKEYNNKPEIKDKIKQYKKKYSKSNKSKRKCLFCNKWIQKAPSHWNKHIISNKHKKNLISFIDDFTDTRDSCLNIVKV